MATFNRKDAFEYYDLTYKTVESSALKFVEMSQYIFLPYFFRKNLSE